MPTPPIHPPTAPLSLQTPSRLEPARSARNGMVPNAVFESELAAALNFVGAVRSKQYFNQGCDLSAIPAGSGTTRDRWRFGARTGPLLNKVHARVTLGQHNITLGSGVNPTVTLYLESADGSTVYGQASASFGATGSTPSDVPSEWSDVELEIFFVPADTAIYGRFEESDGGRLIAACVYEESLAMTAANGYVVPSPVSVTAPIYDARRQTMYELGTLLWKQGAAHLINWTADMQSSPRLTAFGTARNLVDNTSTAVGADTPGYTLDLRYCRTLATTTVPCVLAVYGAMSSGTDSGQVKILDSSGSTIGSVTITSTTASWHTAVVDMPATHEKFDLQFRCVTGGLGDSFTVGAVSLYQYA